MSEVITQMKKWSREEVETLAFARRHGLSMKQITSLPIFHGRTKRSIYKRCRDEDGGLVYVPNPRCVERKCLCCPQKLQSEGPHHRLCDDCRSQA